MKICNRFEDGQLYHTVRHHGGGPWPFAEKFFLNMNMAVVASGDRIFALESTVEASQRYG